MDSNVAPDASELGLSVVLLYEDGSTKRVFHFSRSLIKSEKRYSQTEKEPLAISFAVKIFHSYLHHRSYFITNSPLTFTVDLWG